MNKFVDRDVELRLLRQEYASAGQSGRLAVVYGRRRLGKTALLREFARGLPHAYFMADQAGEATAKRSLALALAHGFGEPLLESLEFPTWYDVFRAIDRFRDSSKPCVLILDEYQYLTQVQPAFSSFLQKWWDEHWKDARLLLVLCGSVTSMMYRETLGRSAPLYGRSTAQVLLQPLPCASLREFLPGRTVPQLVEFYGLAGGVPRYLEMAAAYPDFAAAFGELVLQRHGLLYREARSVLQDEITKPNTCWSILQALGSGVTRITELGGRLALPANQLTRYIELLRDLFLVRRDVPVLEANPARSKKGIYQVTDPFLGLWFGCVYPYESLLEFDESARAAERLAPLVEGHMARCFERICREYVARRQTGYGCVRVGRQWGAHYDIDVAGVSDRECLAVVGECKWSKRPVGLSLLHELQRKLKSEKLPVEPSLRFLLFCPAGFSAELEAEARKDGRIELVQDPFAPVPGGAVPRTAGSAGGG